MASDEASALSGPLQAIELRTIIDGITQDAFSSLRSLSSNDTSVDEEQRKKGLLRHLHETRQRLLRLLVVVQWSNKAKAVLEVSKVLEKAASHAGTLREAADQLFHQHNDPGLIRAPLHDLPTALHILQTGEYNLLPAVTEEAFRGPANPTPKQRASAIGVMNQLLRTQLLKESLPAGLHVVRIVEGAAELRNEDDFEVNLILVPGPPILAEHKSADVPAEGGGEDTAVTGEGEKSEGATVKPEEDAMEIDTDLGNPGPSPDQQPVDKWRWRIASLTLLPGTKRKPWLDPRQTAFLQQHTDHLMWQAADVAAQRPLRAAPESGTDAAAEPSRPEPGMSQQLPAASGSSRSSRPVSESGAGASQPAVLPASDKPVHPLDMMQRVLRLSAHRLVILDAMRWAQKQVEDRSQRWHGLLRRDKAKTLTGGRIDYWPGMKVLSAAEAQTISADLKQMLGFRTAPPALELGLDQGSQLTVLHEPMLQHVSPDGSLAGEANLRIDMHTANLEDLILRAAALNADIQLGSILKMLTCRKEIQNNGGTIVFHQHSPDLLQQNPGSVAGRSSGMLELVCRGKSLLFISVLLTTGQLLLRPGSYLQDSMEVAAFIRRVEENLLALQKGSPPGDFKASEGAFALMEICRALDKLYIQLSFRQNYLSLASQMVSHGLVQVPLPSRLLKAYFQGNKLAPTFSNKHLLINSFPLPPPIFPELLAASKTQFPAKKHSAVGLSSTPSPALSPLPDPLQVLPTDSSSKLGTVPPSPGQNPSSPADQASLPESRNAASGVQTAEGSSKDRSEADNRGLKVALRARAVLGEGGCGLQFLLCSELKAGMQWQYSLLTTSVNRLGQPVKVISLRKVPKFTGSPLQRKPSAKRKRSDSDPGNDPLQPSDQGGNALRNEIPANEGSGTDFCGMLAWCQQQALIEMLSLQLQVAGVPFQCVMAASAASKRRKANSGTYLGPATPAELFQQSSNLSDGSSRQSVHSAQASKTKEGGECGSATFHLGYFSGLEKLDNTCQDAGRRAQAEITLEPLGSSQNHGQGFVINIPSPFLASLHRVQSQDHRLWEGSEAEASFHADGVQLAYSLTAGATAWVAIREVESLVALHTSAQRLQNLCRVRTQASREEQSTSSIPDTGLTWESAGSGRVEMKLVSPGSLQFEVYSARDWQNGGHAPEESLSVETLNPGTPPATVFFPEGIKEAKPAEESQDGKGEDLFQMQSFRDDFALDSADLGAFKTHQSAIQPAPRRPSRRASAAPKRATAPSSDTEKQEQCTGFGRDPVLVATMTWQPQGSAAGQEPYEGGSVGGVRHMASLTAVQAEAGQRNLRCRLKTEPQLPQPVITALEAMLEAGDEEGVLSLLCHTGASLAQLVSALQPETLAECGLKPGDVAVQWANPPTEALLLVHEVSQDPIRLRLGFRAASLVWISVQGSTSDNGNSVNCYEEALKIRAVTPDNVGMNEAKDDAQTEGLAGVWCRNWALPRALTCIMLKIQGVK